MIIHKEYPPLEEKINVVSHALGSILSLIGLILLFFRTNFSGSFLETMSIALFGASLIILYSISALYHHSKNPITRSRFRILDHASIYVLIAGTYSPFSLITLNGLTGWIVFGVVWGIAIAGIILKLFYTGRFSRASTIMYICMGWIVIFVIKPLIANLETEALIWLFSGGVFYTLGAVLYSIRRLKFNHAIFHICVLGGSFCHYYVVYFYVLG